VDGTVLGTDGMRVRPTPVLEPAAGRGSESSAAATRTRTAKVLGGSLRRVALPELVRRHAVAVLEAFCLRRVPERFHDEVRLEVGVRGDAVTIFERRAPWRSGIGPEWTSRKIAQIRHDPSTGLWTLYWPDRNGRCLLYPDAVAARSIEVLIDAIDGDRSAAFFG